MSNRGSSTSVEPVDQPTIAHGRTHVRGSSWTVSHNIDPSGHCSSFRGRWIENDWINEG
jgi:hypothetical protein